MFKLLKEKWDYYFPKIRQNNIHSKANFIPINLKDLDNYGATIVLLKNNWDNTFTITKY